MDKTDSANQNLRAGANRKKGVLLAALLLLSLFLWLGRKGEEEVREVARPKVGKRKQEVELEVRIGEKGENWSLAYLQRV